MKDITSKELHLNLAPEDLIKIALERGDGVLVDSGALVVDTGAFTGRAPKDKYIVCDSETEGTVWWGDVNHKMSVDSFEILHKKILNYLKDKEIFVREAYVCADPKYRIDLQVVTEHAWQNLVAHNLFIQPEGKEKQKSEWLIISVPNFKADPRVDGTRAENFTIINFTKKTILIGGTGYAGEIKKAMFTVLNYLLPKKGILPMHCSANVGIDGDTALFFGLSGTGKTTLSADPTRELIGDDEHGWGEDGVFNFEGGCYAKCVNLSKSSEPEIFCAIKRGAVVENVNFFENTNTIDFANISKTENTRVTYPIHFMQRAKKVSTGNSPKNIFFLTCDALGAFPPISKLNSEEAMYHYLSGYTAKIAGTEVGVVEPAHTFSACFGQAFLPLHPKVYAEMLGKKLKDNPNINVWLVNTGWGEGGYKAGKRVDLSNTRTLIHSALSGKLQGVKSKGIPKELREAFGKNMLQYE